LGGKTGDASFVLDEMSRLIPPSHIPYSSEQTALIVADLYRRLGRDGDMDEQFKHVLQGTRVSRDERIWLAGYYGQFLNKWDRAEDILLELINENKEDVQVYSELFRVYQMSEQNEKGIRLLENWLLRHPEDVNAQEQLEQLKRLAGRDSLDTGENQEK
jgi:predicted Zn-dependent protease